MGGGGVGGCEKFQKKREKGGKWVKNKVPKKNWEKGEEKIKLQKTIEFKAH
jgi:hypothetical protein